jgi:hypothetical protein
VTDRLIRITTALAVATVAAVAAVISYRHAYELVSTHGETGITARLLPFTVDGLILAASAVQVHHAQPAAGYDALTAHRCTERGAGGPGLAPSRSQSARQSRQLNVDRRKVKRIIDQPA